MLDLKDMFELTAIRISFTHKRNYAFIIEASADGKTWKKVGGFDQLKQLSKNGQELFKFNTLEARYIKVSKFKSSKGNSISVKELEVYPFGASPKK